ncbi:MAG: PepSY domain-containing protein [Polaromonas sp.]
MAGSSFRSANRVLSTIVLSIPFLACISVYASGPVESLVCTSAPRQKWVGESKIREAFGESAYAKVFFKISKGNCYEFYAIGKDGSIVEAYYDPVSMRPVRISRFDRNGNPQQPGALASAAQTPALGKAATQR